MITGWIPTCGLGLLLLVHTALLFARWQHHFLWLILVAN